jgi:hypothetical protein
MNIRNYTHHDYEMLCSWFKEAKEIAPEQGQLPEESTFVTEVNNIPAALVSVFLTNVDICYMENLIANPEFKNRKEIVQNLMDYAFSFAKSKGYKYSVGFTMHEQLAKRHINIGWDKKVNNVIIVYKEL